MDRSFEGRVALVAGTASGLGLAAATRFAEAGVAVAMAEGRVEAVRRAAARLGADGHRTLAPRCDVANDARVEAS